MEEFDGITPEGTFLAEREGGTWSCYYSEADESFESEDLYDLIKEMRDFLESDSTVSEIGKRVVITLQ